MADAGGASSTTAVEHFGARRIVIRWHPSMLEPPHLSRYLTDLSGVEESPRTAALRDVAGQCDWVIADENSNVHLPVLKLGIPTVAVKALGLYPESRVGHVRIRRRTASCFRPFRRFATSDADALAAFFEDGWGRGSSSTTRRTCVAGRDQWRGSAGHLARCSRHAAARCR